MSIAMFSGRRPVSTAETMAGREELMVAIKLAAAEQAVEELLEGVRQLNRCESGGTIS